MGAYLLPGADSSSIMREQQVYTVIKGRGHRAILSGIGGDEVLGGVPTAKPELANYLHSRSLRKLMGQAVRWSLVDRVPLFSTLLETFSYLEQLYNPAHTENAVIPPWLQHSLHQACVDCAAEDVVARDRTHTPSSISNGLTWWRIMETQPHIYPGLLIRPEYRYPYLDKQLVDYLFSIPPEQLVRPGRRRSLMRRALKDIVPTEVLDRRRKGYQIRGPLLTLQRSHRTINTLFEKSLIVESGLVEVEKLRAALDLTIQGHDFKWRQAITRAITLELWIRSGVLSLGFDSASPCFPQISLSNGRAHEIRAH
jgi:asparagine synthase (glutamine-hydrolysing)